MFLSFLRVVPNGETRSQYEESDQRPQSETDAVDMPFHKSAAIIVVDYSGIVLFHFVFKVLLYLLQIHLFLPLAEYCAVRGPD